MSFIRLVEGALKFKASDIHLQEGSPPYFRVDGNIIPLQEAAMDHDAMMRMLEEIMPQRLQGTLEQRRAADFSFQHEDKTRCRLVAFYERQKLRVVVRLIPLSAPTLEMLEVPPALSMFKDFRFGMILVTGPTGSGKSTTLAALIGLINSTKKYCIITIEDPIEFTHENIKSTISQREVGEDVVNFNDGLVQAMRQDPDVILVGEMRDMETMGTAIRAAETGHLLFSTLHTTTAVQTIERIISTFPTNQHAVLIEQLGVNLRAIVTQTLLRRIGGKGRIPVLEIMINTPTIRKLILEKRVDDIPGVMRSKSDGMQVFDQALAEVVRAKKVDRLEARSYAKDEFAFDRYVKGVAVSTDAGGIIGGFG
ncbi:PilT/PilU family type 4a pilus ATPase [Candidatus Sumerlaeota bacterium]|nr:PilT/PilU family type 4a pilus ATPase [Candidatus Sumerlaeota bacterium]